MKKIGYIIFGILIFLNNCGKSGERSTTSKPDKTIPSTSDDSTNTSDDSTSTSDDSTNPTDSSDIPNSGCKKNPPALGKIVKGPKWGINPDYLYQLTVKGKRREYILRYPKNYNRNQAYPVVFMFHGTGDSGQNFDYTQVEQAGLNKAIFVLPIGLEYIWGNNKGSGWENFNKNSRDLDFFDELLKTVGKSYCVDQNKIFVTGHSVGGYFSNYLACERGDKITAIASISGGGMYDWYLKNKKCSGKISVLVLHGLSDQDTPVSESKPVINYFLKQNKCKNNEPIEFNEGCKNYLCSSKKVSTCLYKNKGHSNLPWKSVGSSVWNFFMNSKLN